MTGSDSLAVMPTLALLAVGAGVFVFAAWRSGRPGDPARGPRMIPWTVIALTAAVWCLVMIVHLANLAGIETGRSLR